MAMEFLWHVCYSLLELTHYSMAHIRVNKIDLYLVCHPWPVYGEQ